MGSPPPMRGKDFRKYHHQHLARITPAYAGKRYSKFKTLGAKRDHPRLCGEKAENCHNIVKIQGSPPPMRGKGSLWSFRCLVYGITPAYAGKRSG